MVGGANGPAIYSQDATVSIRAYNLGVYTKWRIVRQECRDDTINVQYPMREVINVNGLTASLPMFTDCEQDNIVSKSVADTLTALGFAFRSTQGGWYCGGGAEKHNDYH